MLRCCVSVLQIAVESAVVEAESRHEYTLHMDIYSCWTLLIIVCKAL